MDVLLTGPTAHERTFARTYVLGRPGSPLSFTRIRVFRRWVVSGSEPSKFPPHRKHTALSINPGEQLIESRLDTTTLVSNGPSGRLTFCEGTAGATGHTYEPPVPCAPIFLQALRSAGPTARVGLQWRDVVSVRVPEQMSGEVC